jgi:hypothetical protein
VPNRPLKRDELLKRLKLYGIVVLKRRGKGSEAVLLQPCAEGSRKGETYTIKDHGKKTEISGPAIGAILRRFKIDPDEFWK